MPALPDDSDYDILLRYRIKDILNEPDQVNSVSQSIDIAVNKRVRPIEDRLQKIEQSTAVSEFIFSSVKVVVLMFGASILGGIGYLITKWVES